ncbi:hypothetical protein BJY01DRAFT_247645 [Aspergillus pseudoustus]|uniref:Major facilitator superfamily domain-containing protein n=1 Tax=Aspergillus pseudoustus TaxID=1810923 RepID=A0ABR4JZJ2_9EURO
MTDIKADTHTTTHIETALPWSPQELRLVRRIDMRIMPWLCITFAMSLIDRTNISAARIAGMKRDLHLGGNRYSIVLMVFFITYIAVELPSNALIRRLSVKGYLPVLVAAWGAGDS